MSHWSDEYITMIEDCEKRSESLTDWEADFIDSLRHRLEGGGHLSPKQIEHLEQVWEKATKRG